MQTFNQKLKDAQAEFKAKKLESYKKPAMPEVLAYLRGYIQTGLYPYNAEVAKVIAEKEKVDSDMLDYLETEVYLAQNDYRAEKQAAQDKEMLGLGFKKITPEITYRGPVRVRAKMDHDFLASRVDTEGKIIESPRYGAFFIPKGKRTRGYPALSLKGYYQPITN